MDHEECWAVETSRDGERWRFFGRAWKAPGEPVIIHAAPRYVRVRRLIPDEQAEWSAPIESAADHPMSLVRMDEGTRDDLWPARDHVGLPVLLPGGEEGRLERFEHAEDGSSWTYSLEFRGGRERPRS